jgi:hypothetical protein
MQSGHVVERPDFFGAPFPSPAPPMRTPRHPSLDASNRISNSIRYTSPEWRGSMRFPSDQDLPGAGAPGARGDTLGAERDAGARRGRGLRFPVRPRYRPTGARMRSWRACATTSERPLNAAAFPPGGRARPASSLSSGVRPGSAHGRVPWRRQRRAADAPGARRPCRVAQQRRVDIVFRRLLGVGHCVEFGALDDQVAFGKSFTWHEWSKWECDTAGAYGGARSKTTALP